MAHAHTHDYSARTHPEFVAIDIGDDIGALILHADASLHGVEIEISLTGEDDHRSHKQVLQRKAGGAPAYTAVYDGLREGTYTLWLDGVARVRGVEITGGLVAELDFSRMAQGVLA